MERAILTLTTAIPAVTLATAILAVTLATAILAVTLAAAILVVTLAAAILAVTLAAYFLACCQLISAQLHHIRRDRKLVMHPVRHGLGLSLACPAFMSVMMLIPIK